MQQGFFERGWSVIGCCRGRQKVEFEGAVFPNINVSPKGWGGGILAVSSAGEKKLISTNRANTSASVYTSDNVGICCNMQFCLLHRWWGVVMVACSNLVTIRWLFQSQSSSNPKLLSPLSVIVTLYSLIHFLALQSRPTLSGWAYCHHAMVKIPSGPVTSPPWFQGSPRV